MDSCAHRHPTDPSPQTPPLTAGAAGQSGASRTSPDQPWWSLNALGTPSPGKDWTPHPSGSGQDPGPWGRGTTPTGEDGTQNSRKGPQALGWDHQPLGQDGTLSPGAGRDPPSTPPGSLTAAPRVASVPRGGHSRCPARPVTAGDTVRPHLSGADSRRGAGAARGTRPPLVQHPRGDSGRVPRDRVSRRVTPARPVPGSASGSQKYPRSPKIARDVNGGGALGIPGPGPGSRDTPGAGDRGTRGTRRWPR